jgi:hypothetical protein
LSKIGATIKPGDIVGKVMSEAAVKKIFNS